MEKKPKEAMSWRAVMRMSAFLGMFMLMSGVWTMIWSVLTIDQRFWRERPNSMLISQVSMKNHFRN